MNKIKNLIGKRGEQLEIGSVDLKKNKILPVIKSVAEPN